MTDSTHAPRRTVSRRLTEQAAQWYLEQGEGLGEKSRAEFLRWLCASPDHLAEYLAIARLHGDLKAVTLAESASVAQLIALAQAEPSVVDLPLARAVRPAAPATEYIGAGPRRRVRLGLVAVLLGVALLSGAAMWRAAADRPLAYAATHTPRRVTLPDGSVVQLDRRSTIAVRFSARQRRIELLQGRALIDVGKDSTRPLLVQFGPNTLQDVGTVFGLSLGAHESTVTVLSGEVRVLRQLPSSANVSAPASSMPATGTLAILHGGQQAQMDAAGELTKLAAADLAQATAWLPDTIAFDHRTVAEVARRFDAYTSKPLRIEDPALAALRISGVFHARDSEAFLSYLQTLPGVHVRREADSIRVTRMASVGSEPGRL
ncbi:MAG: FecR domain-containing protein [Dyella sp.]